MRTPQQVANNVFWSTFLVVVFVPAAFAVIPRVGNTAPEHLLLLAFGSVGALILPAALTALFVSRPVRVHEGRGPWASLFVALVAIACALRAGFWWAGHTHQADIGWPLTGAIVKELGLVSILIFPLLILTAVVDVFIQIVWHVAQSLAPALVPTAGALAGAFAAWALSAIVLRVARKRTA